MNISDAESFAVKVLKAHIRNQRLSHAYLISGAGSESLKEMMVSAASALNCLENKCFEPCECISCRKTAQRSHPDVEWIGEDVKAKTLKVEEIRNLISASGLKPFEGRAKVFMVLGVERMSTEASNAFLKTLEEPPQNTYFLMHTSNPSKILDTIKSRCFSLRHEASVRAEFFAAEVLRRDWNEWIEQYQTAQKADLQNALTGLLNEIRTDMEQCTADPSAHIEVIEKIVEIQDALDQNVNQKLALTRLAIHLERHLAR